MRQINPSHTRTGKRQYAKLKAALNGELYTTEEHNQQHQATARQNLRAKQNFMDISPSTKGRADAKLRRF